MTTASWGCPNDKPSTSHAELIKHRLRAPSERRADLNARCGPAPPTKPSTARHRLRITRNHDRCWTVDRGHRTPSYPFSRGTHLVLAGRHRHHRPTSAATHPSTAPAAATNHTHPPSENAHQMSRDQLTDEWPIKKSGFHPPRPPPSIQRHLDRKQGGLSKRRLINNTASGDSGAANNLLQRPIPDAARIRRTPHRSSRRKPDNPIKLNAHPTRCAP